MVFKAADRVQEISATTGTGSFVVSGPPTGFQTWLAGLGNGNSAYYAAVLDANWEVGETVLTGGNTLSRTPIASSNGGALVNFPAGAKKVFLDYPATRAVFTTPTGKLNVDVGALTGTMAQFDAALSDANFVYQGYAATLSTLTTGQGVTDGQYHGTEFGGARQGNGGCYLDLHSTQGTDYEVRIMREPGLDGTFFINNTGLGQFHLTNFGSAAMVFNVNGVERMRIQPDGAVGIGVAAPTASSKLHVVGNVVSESLASNDGYFRTKNTNADWIMGQLGALNWSRWSLYNNLTGGECISVAQGGNVGIGVADPIRKLHVAGDLQVNTDAVVAGTIYTVNMSLTGSIGAGSLTTTGNITCGGAFSNGTMNVADGLTSGEIVSYSTNAVRGAGAVYLGIYDTSGRKGWWGYGAANDTFYVTNECAGGAMWLQTPGNINFITAGVNTVAFATNGNFFYKDVLLAGATLRGINSFESIDAFGLSVPQYGATWGATTDSGGGIVGYFNSWGGVRFCTGSAERMRIATDGKVNIGTTNNPSLPSGALLTVNNINSNPSTAAGVNAIRMGENSGNGTYYLGMGMFYDGTWQSAIDSVSGGGPATLRLNPTGGTVTTGGNLSTSGHVYVGANLYVTAGVDITGGVTIHGGLYTLAGIQNTGTINTGAINASDGTGLAQLRSNGDVWANRGNNTGVIYFGGAGTNYLFWDGTSYQMPGGQLNIGGAWAFSGRLNAWQFSADGLGRVYYEANGPTYVKSTNGYIWQNASGSVATLDGLGGFQCSGTISTNGAINASGGCNINGTGLLNGYGIWSDGNLQYTAPGAMKRFTSNGNMYDNTGGWTLEAYCSDGGAASMGFHRAGYYGVRLGLDTDNIFRLGAWSAGIMWACDTAGNFVATGNVAAFSDERLKRNWRDVRPDFVERLAEVKSGVYERTDVEITQAGVSAQALQQVLPEAVNVGDNDMLTVAYGNAALLSAVELAKKVVELEARLARLEALL